MTSESGRGAHDLQWVCAFGPVDLRGLIRVSADDFRVVERSGITPTGAGEHALLRVRKTDQNTSTVARALARLADVPARDVGYAGRKDRRAVTEQWFSVRLAGKAEPDWTTLDVDGVEILETIRHDRKLRTGALTGNRFDIVVRGLEGERGTLDERLDAVRRDGVPNYFGPQRFGRGGSNLTTAFTWLRTGRRPRSRDARSMALSAARASVFNDVLSERVRGGSWHARLAGDVFGLDGSRGFFADDASDELAGRLAAGDIHPTGPLPGTGDSPVTGEARALELRVLEDNAELVDGLVRMKMRADRRPLRVIVRELDYELGADWLRLGFALPPGSFATSVLREIVDLPA